MNESVIPAPPPEHADKPNLWRLACELSKFKNPRKAADLMLALGSPFLEPKVKEECWHEGGHYHHPGQC